MPVRTDGIVDFGFNPEARIQGDNSGMANGTNQHDNRATGMSGEDELN